MKMENKLLLSPGTRMILEINIFLRILSLTFIFISLPFHESYPLLDTISLTHTASKKQETVWAQVYSQKHEYSNPPVSVQVSPPSLILARNFSPSKSYSI